MVLKELKEIFEEKLTKGEWENNVLLNLELSQYSKYHIPIEIIIRGKDSKGNNLYIMGNKNEFGFPNFFPEETIKVYDHIPTLLELYYDLFINKNSSLKLETLLFLSIDNNRYFNWGNATSVESIRKVFSFADTILICN